MRYNEEIGDYEDEEPEQQVMAVLWSNDIDACMIEFEPGYPVSEHRGGAEEEGAHPRKCDVDYRARTAENG